MAGDSNKGVELGTMAGNSDKGVELGDRKLCLVGSSRMREGEGVGEDAC